jgi:hypothetical protein
VRLTRRRARRDERGSVLMLVPVGFLILVLLGAIAVDSAVAYLGQRQLADALSAAANDAATAGIGNTGFYRTGSVTLDPAATAAAVCRSIEAQDDGGLHDLQLSVGVTGAVVVVGGRAEVETVFGRLLPGFAEREVTAQASAAAEEAPGAAPTAAPPLVPVTC